MCVCVFAHAFLGQTVGVTQHRPGIFWLCIAGRPDSWEQGHVGFVVLNWQWALKACNNNKSLFMVPHLVRAQSSYNLKRYNYAHFITHTHTHTVAAGIPWDAGMSVCQTVSQSVQHRTSVTDRPCHGSAVTAWRIASGQKIVIMCRQFQLCADNSLSWCALQLLN